MKSWVHPEGARWCGSTSLLLRVLQCPVDSGAGLAIQPILPWSSLRLQLHMVSGLAGNSSNSSCIPSSCIDFLTPTPVSQSERRNLAPTAAAVPCRHRHRESPSTASVSLQPWATGGAKVESWAWLGTASGNVQGPSSTCSQLAESTHGDRE